MRNMKFWFVVLFLIMVSGCGILTKSISIDELALLHNYERNKKNLSNLEVDSELQQRSQIWAERMASSGSFRHSKLSLSGGYKLIGENIAYGQTTVDEVLNDWMNSRGHRANILNGQYDSIGIGYAKNSKGTIYWCVQFGRKN